MIPNSSEGSIEVEILCLWSERCVLICVKVQGSAVEEVDSCFHLSENRKNRLVKALKVIMTPF